MSCETEGHSGAEDHHIQPRYRCLYCGRWGYTTHWYDAEKEEYETCDNDCTYGEHFDMQNGCEV